ncbi:hypothetical protein [Streptomyces sp. Ac-502]|uniref:hypothetical protein n=1 Tax=Streptomyces sp. Ac-502 TaxID=3342801 RepID=UPI00386244BA
MLTLAYEAAYTRELALTNAEISTASAAQSAPSLCWSESAAAWSAYADQLSTVVWYALVERYLPTDGR